MFDTHHTVRTTSSGFTLVEMLVTVSIVGILLGLAAPSFQSFILDARLTAEAQKFLAAIQYARNEAARTNTSILLCASTNKSSCDTDWTKSKLVFADANGDKARSSSEALAFSGDPSAASTTIVGPSSGWIQFSSAGHANTVNTFKLCDSRTGNVGRLITVEASGRPTMSITSCP